MATTVPQLRKTKSDGTLYSRPEEIEVAIANTCNWTLDEIVSKEQCQDWNDPDYLPSEVLVHYLRTARDRNTDRWFNTLYPLVRGRFLRTFPVSQSSTGGLAIEIDDIRAMRDQQWDWFAERLLLDRQQYEDKLDYFEIRFDHAVLIRKRTGFRNLYRKREKRERSELDEESAKSREVEDALTRRRQDAQSPEEAVRYRFEVREAIDQLPEADRQLLDLLEAGIPIESKDPNVVTISKLLNCIPKTVWNRRDRAKKRYRALMGEETDNE